MDFVVAFVRNAPLKNCFLLDVLRVLDMYSGPSKPVDECIFPTLLAASLLVNHISKLRDSLQEGKTALVCRSGDFCVSGLEGHRKQQKGTVLRVNADIGKSDFNIWYG